MVTETLWPSKPKIFTVWTLKIKFANHCTEARLTEALGCIEELTSELDLKFSSFFKAGESRKGIPGRGR